jgi:hypothetical protein
MQPLAKTRTDAKTTDKVLRMGSTFLKQGDG